MSGDRKRIPFIFHPLVLLASAAILGSLAATRLWPAVAVGIVVLFSTAVAHKGKAKLIVLASLLLFFCARMRAKEAVESFKANYQEQRLEFAEPMRCAGSGVIVTSPTLKLGDSEEPPTSLYSARFSKLSCQLDKELKGPLLVRLADPERSAPGLVDTGTPPLARGDRLDFVVQIAPVRLFRNAALDDPWPGAARRGALLSGSVLVRQRSDVSRSVPGAIDRLRAHVRKRIVKTYAPVVVPLGRALVLGESDLDPEDAQAFQNSGLLHLLAVSGTHLVIFVVSLVRLFEALVVRLTYFSSRWDVKRLPALFGAVLSCLYADFSGGSGSAWRAAYMLLLVSLARALGFKFSGPAALGGSLLLGLAIHPLAASDLSFLLSALATSGLIGLGQPVCRWALRGRLNQPPIKGLLESLIATVASTVPCAPVLALMDDSMTWAALFANVVAAPLGEVIALPACLLHSVMAPFPIVESGLAYIGSGALFGVRYVALQSAAVTSAQFSVPFPSAPSIALLVSALLLSAAILEQKVALWRAARSAGRAGFLKAALAVVCIVFAFFWGAHSSWKKRAGDPAETEPHSARLVRGTPLASTFEASQTPQNMVSRAASLTVTALDVGQGDALFLEFPDGKTALIDGGGFATQVPDTAKRVLLPYLRARAVSALDLMVLSHAHPDHMTGLLGVAEKIPVGQLWLPSSQDGGTSGDFAPAFDCPKTHNKRAFGVAKLVQLVCEKGGQVRTSRTMCGAPFLWGGTRIEIFAPCVPQDPPLGLNDGSLVLRVSYGKHSALFTGDIEERAERLLVEEHGSRLHSDLLKVAHHGSDTSSTKALIRAVAPRFAFISCGVRNRFRHPRPQTLQTLQEQEVAIYRTDQMGSLTYTTDGHTASVLTFDSAPGILSQ